MSKKTPVVLLCWIGGTDLRAAKNNDSQNEGPLRMLLSQERFTHIFLLYTHDQQKEDIEGLCTWLQPDLHGATLQCVQTDVKDPIDHHGIYEATLQNIEKALEITQRKDGQGLVFHISPGASAMQAVLLLLGRLHFPKARIVQTRTHAQAAGGKTVLEVILPQEIDIAKGFNVHAYKENIGHIAFSKRQKKLDAQIQSVATADVNILLLGESGTGKSHIAQCIHEWSGRKGAFVAENCAGLSDTDLTSKLFGHIVGAYTGATRERDGAFFTAKGGTLFLDEIGDMPLSQQTALLLALQPRDSDGTLVIKKMGSDKEIPLKVNIIAATNRPLIEAVQNGAFRADLYYRLAGLSFTLPSVREFDNKEKEDLMSFFLQEACKKFQRTWNFTPKAKELLLQETWPGNIREVAFMIQRICLLSGGGSIIREDIVEEQLLQGRIFLKPSAQAGDFFPLGSGNLDEVLDAMRHGKCLEALDKAQNNKAEAARLLGVPYQKLTYWLGKK